MGKKRMAVLGGEQEQQLRAKTAVKREQKKLREGKTAKAPGLAGGQRVVDTAAESLREYEVVQQKVAEVQSGKVAEEIKKPRPTKHRSQSYLAAKAKVDPEQKYPLSEAIKLLRDISYSKTNTTVELHITLRDKGWAKDIDLPHATGKNRRVAIADAETLAKIEAGQIDFDLLLASPADMPKLVKYAKILGPKGLMPNPKSGTVVDNPTAAAKKLASANTLTLKTEKDAPTVHTVVGKLVMTDDQLAMNISAVLAALPPGAKAVLKSTMSPAVKLAL